MSNKLPPRLEQILVHCRIGQLYTAASISKLLSDSGITPGSAPTLRRELARLCELGFLKKTGDRKSSKYSIVPGTMALAPIDAHGYCALDIDRRAGNDRYSFQVFSGLPSCLFDAADIRKLEEATEKFNASSMGASETLRRKELERFVIELSWKSSKIEGNTYTLLDTELLLREGVEAPGHSREEAVMILNHKKAFSYILEATAQFSEPSVALITDIHRLLVAGLNVAFGLRRRLIGITGSLYHPLSVPTQIEEACAEMIRAMRRMNEPYSKALLMIAGISYIQPFEDGNKRTSRLCGNAVLMAAGCAPLSYRNISEISYREAMLTFYEKNTILPLRNMFI